MPETPESFAERQAVSEGTKALIAGTVAGTVVLESPRLFRELMSNYPEIQRVILDGLAEKASGIENELFDSFYREMTRAITGPLDPVAYQKALNAANDAARIQARSLTTGMMKTQLEAIAKVVADGLEAGKGPGAIARNLDMVKGLDRNRQATFLKQRKYLEELGLPADVVTRREERIFNKLLRQRRETIARTEARYATSEARQVAAVARGARFKVWITVGDDRVSEMDQDNEAQRAIPIDQPFSSGHMQPPSHPNCRCTLAYATSDSQKTRMNDLQEERIKQTAAAKEVTDNIEKAI